MTLRKIIFLSFIFSMLVGCNDPWNSGDRVLVSKCSYIDGVTRPNRYEVVVFRFPEKPMDNNTPKNFIKRLLGLPGEMLAIFFGRLYRWAPQPGEAPPFDDQNAVDAEGKQVDPKTLWSSKYLHADDPIAHRRFEQGDFEILRKPPHVLLALRRIVYDNDFQAADLKKAGFPDRWTPAPKSSWQQDKATGFINDGASTDTVAWLRYQHLLRPDGPLAGGLKEKVKPMLILDTLGYNSLQTDEPPGQEAGDLRRGIYKAGHWVGDLMLECNLEVIEPKGEHWFELSKGHDRFQARFDLATGDCTLFRVGKDKVVQQLAVKSTRVKGAGNYLIRFANIDARLTVWVDRDLPFGDGHEYDPPEILSPKEKGKTTFEKTEDRRGPTLNDLEPASIGSKGAAVKVTHLRLWRDTYYRTSIHGTDFREELDREAWSTPERWNDLRKRYQYTTMYVQPGHYLCLGDNSESSDDSRRWGVVPQRLMLGRALVVYYPFDRVGPIR